MTATVEREARRGLMIYTPKTGDVVLCSYRLPTPWQHWLHPVHVGVVQEPGDDPKTWNGYNSERHYCERCGYLPVQYNAGEGSIEKAFRQHDTVDSLFPAPEGKTAAWMVKDEAEGWALEHRALAYAGRYASERAELVTFAREVTSGGGSSPLAHFGRTSMVLEGVFRDRAAGIARRMLEETIRGRKEHELGEHDGRRARRLRRLAGLIAQAPGYVHLCG